MVLDWDLQDEVRAESRRIENADRVKLGEDTAHTEIIENLHGRGIASGYAFEYDEPEHVAGGGGRGPRPLEYFLAGFAFCQQVQYARSALATGIGFDSLEMDVTGQVDPRGSIIEGDVPAGFEDDEIGLVTHIESEEDPEEIVSLAERAEHRCHAHASLVREMSINREIRLNGETLDL